MHKKYGRILAMWLSVMLSIQNITIRVNAEPEDEGAEEEDCVEQFD